jgi:hypothetical protein
MLRRGGFLSLCAAFRIGYFVGGVTSPLANKLQE